MEVASGSPQQTDVGKRPDGEFCGTFSAEGLGRGTGVVRVLFRAVRHDGIARFIAVEYGVLPQCQIVRLGDTAVSQCELSGSGGFSPFTVYC